MKFFLVLLLAILTLQASIQNADAHSAIVDQYGLHELLEGSEQSSSEHSSDHCCHCYNSSPVSLTLKQLESRPNNEKDLFSSQFRLYQTYLGQPFRPPIQ